MELISRELSQKELQDPDTEFLKQRTVRAISLISENLVDSKVIATDTSTRTRLGLILLATGTFIQSLLLRRADRDDSKDFEHRLGQQKLEQQIKQLIDNIEDQPT